MSQSPVVDIYQRLAASVAENKLTDTLLGQSIAYEVFLNPALGDSITVDDFSQYKVDHVLFVTDAFMARSKELGATNSALFLGIQARRFEWQKDKLKRELESTIEVFTQRWSELETENGSDVLETLKGYISFKLQIEVIKKFQLPKVLEAKTPADIKALAVQASDNTISCKQQEEETLREFNSMVSSQEGFSEINNLAITAWRNHCTYCCWNQFRIQLNDAVKELYI